MKDRFGIIMLRLYIYALTISRGVLYTPTVISLALFITYIPLLASRQIASPLALPHLPYSSEALLGLGSPWIPLIALLLSICEYAFRRIINISIRKKLTVIFILLTLGYFLSGVSLFLKNQTSLTSILIALVPLYALTIISLGLSIFWWNVLRQCDEALEKILKEKQNIKAKNLSIIS